MTKKTTEAENSPDIQFARMANHVNIAFDFYLSEIDSLLAQVNALEVKVDQMPAERANQLIDQQQDHWEQVLSPGLAEEFAPDANQQVSILLSRIDTLIPQLGVHRATQIALIVYYIVTNTPEEGLQQAVETALVEYEEKGDPSVGLRRVNPESAALLIDRIGTLEKSEMKLDQAVETALLEIELQDKDQEQDQNVAKAEKRIANTLAAKQMLFKPGHVTSKTQNLASSQIRAKF